MQIPFNNRYATLGEGFFEKIRPTPVKNPELIKFNEALARQLGIQFRASGATTPRESLLSADGNRRPWSQCRRPRTLIYTTANGNILPCCFSPFTTRNYPGLILGNAFEQSLSEIWNGVAYRRFRSALQTEQPPDSCDRCGVCWSL